MSARVTDWSHWPSVMQVEWLTAAEERLKQLQGQGDLTERLRRGNDELILVLDHLLDDCPTWDHWHALERVMDAAAKLTADPPPPAGPPEGLVPPAGPVPPESTEPTPAASAIGTGSASGANHN